MKLKLGDFEVLEKKVELRVIELEIDVENILILLCLILDLFLKFLIKFLFFKKDFF